MAATLSEHPPVSTPDEVLTPEELGARIKLPPRKIKRLAWEGKIPCMRLGRAYRFDLDAVLRAMAEAST